MPQFAKLCTIQAENLPPLPKSLVEEYTVFGGGAYGDQTYDGYEPKSYFDEMKKQQSAEKREENRRRAGRASIQT